MRVVRVPTGKPIGFGWSFLRDTICRLLYVIPFFGLLDEFWPAGPRRESLRDKIVGTRVLQEPSYKNRAWVLAAAAVGVIACWIALSGVSDGVSSAAFRAESHT